MDELEHKKVIKTYSAEKLQELKLPEIEYRVENLITNGFIIVAAPPKYGKSFMMMKLGTCVATGEPFLGLSTTQCDCLYMALEDSLQRLQMRLNALCMEQKAPKSLIFTTHWPDMDHGMLEWLERYLTNHPETKLIIIDTLQKIRGLTYGREGTYGTDYRELSKIKEFADQHGIAIVVVHHLRKAEDDGDPFNRIAGTNGIMGVADTAIVLTRRSRNDGETVMSVTGRDVDNMELVLRFDGGEWTVKGETDELARQRELDDYKANPCVRLIRHLVEENHGCWSGKLSELLEEGKKVAPIDISARALNGEIKRIERKLRQYDGIVHTMIPNGSGGGKHTFRLVEKDDEDRDRYEV